MDSGETKQESENKLPLKSGESDRLGRLLTDLKTYASEEKYSDIAKIIINLDTDTASHITEILTKEKKYNQDYGFDDNGVIDRILDIFNNPDKYMSEREPTQEERIQDLQDENQKLRDENQTLKMENRDLKDENHKLRVQQAKTNRKVKAVMDESNSPTIEAPIQTAPKLYVNRETDPDTGKQIDIIQFLERYYGQYLTRFNPELEHDLLYQDQVNKLDPKALKALKSYCSKRKLSISDYVKPKKQRTILESKKTSFETLQNIPHKEARRILVNKHRHQL